MPATPSIATGISWIPCRWIVVRRGEHGESGFEGPRRGALHDRERLLIPAHHRDRIERAIFASAQRRLARSGRCGWERCNQRLHADGVGIDARRRRVVNVGEGRAGVREARDKDQECGDQEAAHAEHYAASCAKAAD
jgi:hypothetical protein